MNVVLHAGALVDFANFFRRWQRRPRGRCCSINGINCGAPDAIPKTDRPSGPTWPAIPIARVVGPPEALVIDQHK